MAFEIVVPRLGWSMDEGTFVQWLKQDGDAVEPGEPLFVLESEKAAQDIESLDRGILRIPPNGPQPGETVTVGQVLGFLAAAGEALPEMHGGRRAKNGGPEKKVAERPLTGSRSTPQTEFAAGDRQGAISTTSSPRARRAAKQAGVDWRRVPGTGRGGRVRERDILAVAGPPTKAEGAPTTGRLLPISTVRRTIAGRMLAGTHDAAPVTLTTQADATQLVRLRERYLTESAGKPVQPTYTDLLVKRIAAALEKHPLLAAQWRDDGIFLPDRIHIAVAVDTPAGLLAPVVHDANRLSVHDLAARLQSLIELARGGRLSAEQMQGAVFTVTNLGMYGIDAFTPVISLPQSAVLGVGRIRQQPAVVDGAVVPRPMISLSLTFDHRVVDGAPAARFLQAIAQGIEHAESNPH